MLLRHRVAALFATYFFGLGLFLPYFPMVLEEAGLRAAEIGAVLAVPLVVRLIANPFVSALADRFASPGLALSLLGGLAALGFASLALITGFWAIALLLAATSLAWGPIVPLSDALAARIDREGRGDYGRMRLWGSIAFIAANLIGGVFVGTATSLVVIGGIVGGLVVLSITAWGLPLARDGDVHDADVRMTDAGASVEELSADVGGSTLKTLGRADVMLVLIAAGCVQASHAAYYAFSALYWSGAGLDGVAVGALWGLGVVTEIILFAVAGRIALWIGPGGLLVLGAVAGIVRWVLFPFALDPVSIAALQLLHGLSFGATHLGGVAFVADRAPARWAGAAQGVASTVIGALTALASALAGLLYALGAVFAFFAMAGLAALGLLFLGAGFLMARR